MTTLTGIYSTDDITINGLPTFSTSSTYPTDASFNNISTDNIYIPRINTALVPLLGSSINLTTLNQNLNFDTALREFDFWDDAGTGQMMTIDASNNTIGITPNTLTIYTGGGGVFFTASTVTFTNTPMNLVNTSITFDSTSTIVANAATISNVELSYLDGATSNIQAQINAITSGGFVTLTTTQTITGTKTMNDLLPYFSLNNTSYKMGLNAMATQPSTAANNIAWGTNALKGSTAQGAIVGANRNIVLGDNACQTFNLGTNDDNVVIGYNALKTAFVSNRQNVMIGSNVALNQAVQYRNVFIGYNVVSGSSTGENRDNVVIGANTCIQLAGRAQIVIIGYGNGSSSSSVGNSWTIVGSLNATNAIQGNRICIFGSENLQNINADVFSCAVGNNNGNNQTTGYFNLYWGFNNNIAANNIINSITMGIACIIPRSHCMYLCASTADNITYQNMCIAFKTTTLCCKSVTGVTYNLAFEDEEYIRIADNTMVTVNLPTPTATSGTTKNVGGRWTLLRTQTTATTITINAPSGQTLRTPTGTTASSYTMKATEWYVTITCIFNSGVSYQISSSQQTQISNIANSYENTTNQTVQIGTANIQNVGIHNTLLGYNAGLNLTTGGNTTTAIGHLALSSLTNTILNTAIGAGAGRSQTLSRSTFVGANAAGSSTLTSKSVFLGENTAFSNTTGLLEECTFLGNKSDVAVATTYYRNSTALGAHSVISEMNTIEMGGADQVTGEYPVVVVPNKVKLQTSVLIGATASYTITYRTPETIIVNSSTTTTINLPTPTANSVGMSFKITRAYSTGNATPITIQATSGINIVGAGVVGNTYIFNSLMDTIDITLIASSGTAWSISGHQIETVYAIGTATTYSPSFPPPQTIIVDSLNTTDIYLPGIGSNTLGVTVYIVRGYGVTGNTITINPAAFENIEGYDSPSGSAFYMDYTIKSIRLTAETSTTWVAAYSRDYTQNSQIKNTPAAMQVTNATTGNVTVTMSAPYYEYYPFTNVVNSLTYNLPAITTAMVGMKLVYKRFGGTYNAVNFNPSVPYPGHAIFGLGGSALGSTATQALISTTQNTCTIVAMQTQSSFTGTFTNTAGATVVTIVTTNGAIFAGGYFSFNGNTRYITSCGTGRGGTGTYNIDTSITLANTNQPFTANVSYGWMVLHQG